MSPDPETPAQGLFGPSLPAGIRDWLEEAIIDGRIPPGTRLRPDELASQFQVSRIPVREALSALDASGWVEIRPRYGVYVRRRTRGELAELFEARAGIEQEIARLAAIRADEDDLQRLEQTTRRSRDAARTGDTDELSAAAVDYNAHLRTAGGNRVLAGLSLVLEKRARFYFSPIATLLATEWVEGQERLLALLQNRDAEGAARSARAHIEDTGRGVSRLLGSEAFSD